MEHDVSTAKAKTGPRKSYTRYGLTAAELDVLSYLSDGIQNLEIAKRRGKDISTIKVQLTAIYRKLEVGSAKQAIPIGRGLPEVQELQRRRAGVKPSAYERLLQHMTAEAREAGDILFRAGDPADTLYFVQEGCVLLVEIDKRRGPGDWIGEMGMFTSEGTRTRTAKCETKTKLLGVSRDQANTLFHEQPEFLIYVTKLMANRFREDSERAAEQEVVA
jgi:DNA-binding CsgD family transcriptional regulator